MVWELKQVFRLYLLCLLFNYYCLFILGIDLDKLIIASNYIDAALDRKSGSKVAIAQSNKKCL